MRAFRDANWLWRYSEIATHKPLTRLLRSHPLPPGEGARRGAPEKICQSLSPPFPAMLFSPCPVDERPGARTELSWDRAGLNEARCSTHLPPQAAPIGQIPPQRGQITRNSGKTDRQAYLRPAPAIPIPAAAVLTRAGPRTDMSENQSTRHYVGNNTLKVKLPVHLKAPASRR